MSDKIKCYIYSDVLIVSINVLLYVTVNICDKHENTFKRMVVVVVVVVAVVVVV